MPRGFFDVLLDRCFDRQRDRCLLYGFRQVLYVGQIGPCKPFIRMLDRIRDRRRKPFQPGELWIGLEQFAREFEQLCRPGAVRPLECGACRLIGVKFVSGNSHRASRCGNAGISDVSTIRAISLSGILTALPILQRAILRRAAHIRSVIVFIPSRCAACSRVRRFSFSMR